MTIHELDTPALVIDLDVMERNLHRMSDYVRERKLNLRPHTKTHKIPDLGRRQIELGAVGLTVAKPGEAEVMLKAQPQEVLVAYPTFGRQKMARLAEVAKHTKLIVSVDSTDVARPISEAAKNAGVEIGILTEVDVGLGRVGVDSGEALDQLVASIKKLPNLKWEGIAFYPGHIKSLDDEGLGQLKSLSEKIGRIVDRLKPRIVSGGSTPSWEHSHEIAGMNEIRPGTYIFNDKNSAEIGCCGWEDCAATVIATVVSTAVKGQVIIDGGSKTFSSDRLITGADGFGRVLNGPAEFVRMNEEHGFVKTEEPWRVGDRLRIIPNHVCVVVNLHEKIYGVRGENVETVWTVDARGKLQ